jgi:type II secretory pathway component PulF
MNTVERFFAKTTFSGQKKVRIIRQIQRLINADVPITTTLDMLFDLYSKKGKKPKEPMAQMVKEWQQKLNQGKSLALSMEGWISLPEQMIIEAGEQSDKLAVALDDALQAENASRGIKKAILGGLAYPAILLLALVGILWGFSTEIVPTFATILPPENWVGSAAKMYAISQFVVTWLPALAMVFGGAIVAAIISMPILTGPLRRILDHLPPWSIYKITQGASYMIAMRGFVSAGTTVPDALRNMLKIGNPYFKERVSAILAKINMGRNLGELPRQRHRR